MQSIWNPHCSRGDSLSSASPLPGNQLTVLLFSAAVWNPTLQNIIKQKTKKKESLWTALQLHWTSTGSQQQHHRMPFPCERIYYHSRETPTALKQTDILRAAGRSCNTEEQLVTWGHERTAMAQESFQDHFETPRCVWSTVTLPPATLRSQWMQEYFEENTSAFKSGFQSINDSWALND